MGRKNKEHVGDTFKLKLVDNRVHGQEVMSWDEENQELHRKNRDLVMSSRSYQNLLNYLLLC